MTEDDKDWIPPAKREVQRKLTPSEIKLFRQEADLIIEARRAGVLACDLKLTCRILYRLKETPGPIDFAIRARCAKPMRADSYLDLDDDY